MDTPPTGSTSLDVREDETEYCYGHPKTPTKLHCSRCGRPICGRCAIPASVGQHCPECVAEARRSQPRVRSALRATAPVVTTILGINIAVFVGQQVIPGLEARGILLPQAIVAGEWWRLITPMFMHASILHILLNSYVLFALGPNVEQAFGHVKFGLMYLAAGFLGNAFSFALPPNNPSLGASGAIFGLAGILFVYLYKRRRSTFIGQYLRSIVFFIVANLILGFALSFVIDNFAHLGGLVGGLILGAGFDRDDQLAPVTSTLATLLVVVAGIFLVVWRIGVGF